MPAARPAPLRLFPDVSVRTVRSFLSALERVQRDRELWFRGQTNRRKPLIPGLMRESPDHLTQELTLVKRFRQNAFALLPAAERNEWDWLLLMQHWGTPTRLLDWTENPLAGLYFAVVSVNERVTTRTDGCVWCLDPIALNRVAIPRETDELPFLEGEPLLEDYVPTKLAKSANLRPPAAVLVERKFPRLVAQLGVFTVFHRDRTPIERIPAAPLVGQIIIPRDAKTAVARELERIGIARLALFPELESAAEFAKSRLK